MSDESEFSWGAGQLPPGTEKSNYEKAAADRRTDPTDPESTRDYSSLGNPDRYGGQPPLVREELPDMTTQQPPAGDRKLERKP